MIVLLLTTLISQGVDSALPPAATEVWLCPVHRDQQSTTTTDCPVCARPMVKRYLRAVWACPMHPGIEEDRDAPCPICNMRLMPTMRELQWFCPRHPAVVRTDAGSCPLDGEPLAHRAVAMPHGDHNPRHGGILFMAPNGYHHVEGTLSPEGVFRLYFYDDFTRPIDPSEFVARIGKRELQPSADGGFLEVRLDEPLAFPAEIRVGICWEEGAEEEPFDFVFASGEASATAPALGDVIIPERIEDITTEIHVRHQRLRQLVQRGAWTDLFIPALEAKELALALEARDQDMALAVKKLVRAAWLLDLYGDRGNRAKVESAYRLFEAGIEELERVRAR